MINIEKRKFLAELGRLLTFMYDEDRQTALSMYSEMFDRTDETEELMKLLVSPTRQAVVIARAYNAKERDLTVRTRAGEGDADIDSSETPRFVRVISEISEKASELFPDSSYSGAWGDADGTEAEPEDWEPSPDIEGEEPEDVQVNPSDDPFAFATAEFPVFSEAEEEIIPQQETDESEEVSPEQEFSEAEYPDSAVDENEEFSAEEHSNRINEYMASFAAPDQDELQNADDRKAVSAAEEIRTWRDKPVQEKKANAGSDQEEAAGEISIPLLILYIILAVPVTAIGVMLLLVPAILCLAISLILIVIGFQAITTAFGGFAVFADIMVVLGGALVIIAIALCALWAFIWFIGGAIVSLINSAIRLGGKFCTSGGGK